MPSFKLDGRDVEFSPGETVIEAARKAGVDIPHYCWHPGLSVAANCRMCLVEVGPPPGRPALMLNVLEYDAEKGEYFDAKKPKLQPSCQLGAVEGMEVKSESSEHVKRARAAVQEMLLLNHPVDCPICDQAGECRLQDYWLEHQSTDKRMKDETIRKPKAQDFGPTIVYDAERCIVCTRCIRFSEEIAKDPVLDLRDRGNLAEVVVAPGRELDHDYTLMTEHVCPVGALTAKDFRFKARVWFLRSSQSICQGCSTGCNAFLDYDPRDQTVYRHRPRENAEVNKFWMCDKGMLDYRRIHENRLLEPTISGKSADVGAALEKAVELLKDVDSDKLAVVLSAQHSNEDNFALLTLAQEHLGSKALFLAARPSGPADDILINADKNPNTAGATAVCGSTPPKSFSELLTAIGSGKISHVLALSADVEEDLSPLSDLKALVVLSTHDVGLAKAATVALPASSWAECDGTFVNEKGASQASESAIKPQGASRPAWKLAGAIGMRLGKSTPWKSLDDFRGAVNSDAAAAGVDVGVQPGASA